MNIFFTIVGATVTVCAGLYAILRLSAFCEGRDW